MFTVQMGTDNLQQYKFAANLNMEGIIIFTHPVLYIAMN